MNSIVKTSRKLLLMVSILFGLFFLIFMANQFVLFFDLLTRIHPYLASIVTSLLALAILYLIIRMILLWKKSSKLAVLPDNPTEEEKEIYYQSMIYFLKRNPNMKEINFDDDTLTKEELVEIGFQKLDQLSTPIIQKNANEIFLSTAISQNGSLDSIAVLITLMKMVWRLAAIYQTRPTFKSLGKLYIQVASVVFMARTIEDSDLIESQMELLITAILGESIASAIPGMIPITNLIVSSLMEGSLNALLTFRVGIITQSYLGMEKPETKSFIQKNASVRALTQIGGIIKENGKVVARSVLKATKNVTSNTAKKWFKFE